MNLPTFATLLIAATAHAADTKQHVRKASEVEVREDLLVRSVI